MDDREARADRVRVSALIVAAIARIGTNTPPARLMAEAVQYIPWITRPPARMSFAIEGDPMSLNVDSTNSLAVLSFEDDHEEAVAAPEGVLSTATSSDPTIMTVGAAVPGVDANGVATVTFPLTEVASGSATLSVTSTDASGNPLLGPDGVTPIADPDPVVVTVAVGAAASEVFTVPDN
jgi:hypothetical protein